jgi:hypothetical protein
MQQRRLRLGDTVDDYCPRERRVTNHAIAAMVDDQITHTRCTACEADHEYKEARAPRRKREDGSSSQPPGGRIVPHTAPEEEAAVLAALESVSVSVVVDEVSDGEGSGDDGDNAGNREDDNAPVHRRLIRATFPRPEGQAPDWKEPEFTSRQPTHQRRGRSSIRAVARREATAIVAVVPGRGAAEAVPVVVVGPVDRASPARVMARARAAVAVVVAADASAHGPHG